MANYTVGDTVKWNWGNGTGTGTVETIYEKKITRTLQSTTSMTNHDHDAPGHSHVPRTEFKIAIAVLLTGSFMFAEVIGGVVSGSLALIADAVTC